jgi:hypothetical protein
MTIAPGNNAPGQPKGQVLEGFCVVRNMKHDDSVKCCRLPWFLMTLILILILST